MLNSGSFVPVSKLLEHKWKSLDQAKHKERLHAIKAGRHCLVNSLPKQLSHLTVQLKKQQLEKERQEEIKRRNEKLVQNLNRIFECPSDRIDNWNDYESSTLHILQKTSLRRKRHNEIKKDNSDMSNRLMNIRPTYNVGEWEQDFRRHRDIQEMLDQTTKNYECTKRNSQNFYDDPEDFDGKSRIFTSPIPSTISTSSDLFDKPWRRNAKLTKPAPKTQQCESDARMLMKACNQMGASHICIYNRNRQVNEIFIKTLVRRTPKQRQLIRLRFRELYELELEDKLKESLGKDYYGVIEGLLHSPYSDRMCYIHQRIKDIDPFALIDTFLLSDKYSIRCLEQVYKKHYSSSIDRDITDFFGDDDIRNLVLALKQGITLSKDFDKTETEKLAAQFVNAENENSLDSRGVLLQELCQSPQRFLMLCQAINDLDKHESVESTVKKQYDEGVFSVFHHLVESLSKEPHLERLVNSLFAQVPSCRKEFIHELILLSEASDVFTAVNDIFLRKKNSNLYDVIISRCKSNAVSIVAAIVQMRQQKQSR